MKSMTARKWNDDTTMTAAAVAAAVGEAMASIVVIAASSPSRSRSAAQPVVVVVAVVVSPGKETRLNGQLLVTWEGGALGAAFKGWVEAFEGWVHREGANGHDACR